MERLGDFLETIEESIETTIFYKMDKEFVDLLDIKLAVVELVY